MATLYSQQSSNIRKTWFLMTGFLLFIIVLGFILSYMYGNPNFLYIALIISIGMNIFAYWFSDTLVLSMAHARRIESREEFPDYWNTMENLCITAGLPMPKLYVIDDPAPNAFATGRNKNHATVAVTTGLIPLLNKSELEGVLAHELSHIGNRDMLVQTVVVVFAGLIALVADFALRMSFFGGGNDDKKNPIFLVLGIVAIVLAPIAATIIKLAISREREFLADATGALITRYPEGLASALQKISNFHQPMRVQNNAIAHLFISDPTAMGDANKKETKKVSWFTKLFMTHPPVEERVSRLLANSRE